LQAHDSTIPPPLAAPEATDIAVRKLGAAQLRVEYRALPASAPLPAGVLAAFHFQGYRRAAAAGLSVEVALPVLAPAALSELWLAQGPIRSGRAGSIRYAHDDHHFFGIVELDEREFGGIRETTEAAYIEIRRFQHRSRFAYLLRMWNVLGAINDGLGDAERYREFCVGRALGMGESNEERFPAASAVGQHEPTHRLLVYWLAAREPGVALENPRQVSAYRYPRQYGPAAPSFARATLAADGSLLISGTASIVGHASQHPDDLPAQLEETMRNVNVLVERAASSSQLTYVRQGALLKVYLRDAAQHSYVTRRLAQLWPGSQILVLQADICRSELLLEIEAVVLPEREIRESGFETGQS
jgi:chorismate lyase/3-hydroxybenzoate synthase